MLQSLLSISSDHDADNVLLSVTKSAMRALHLTAESALTAHPVDADALAGLVHPNQRAFFRHALGWVRDGGAAAPLQLQMTRDDGVWISVITSLAPGQDGTPVLSISLDEAAAARRSEAQIRQIVESARQAVTVRIGTRTVFANHALADLMGYASLAEMRAKGGDVDHIHIHPEDRDLVWSKVHARAAGKDVGDSYDFRMVRIDGSVIWVNTVVSRVHWNGQPASLAWVIDITERRRVEEELRHSREAAVYANRAKSEFLANMSHELRTPLNAIIGFSEIIAGELYGPIGLPRYAEYARDIHGSGAHLLQIINDLLDLSKLEAGKQDLHESEVDLSDLAQASLRLIGERAKSAGVALDNAMPDELPHVLADERLMKQILINLLSNAVKFTPAGGRVTVNAQRTVDGGIRLAVVDTGVGMSPAEVRVALSPFGQVDGRLARRHEGTGLGLPLVQSLSELHGGRIEVESVPDEGTSVSVFLPPQRVLQGRSA